MIERGRGHVAQTSRPTPASSRFRAWRAIAPRRRRRSRSTKTVALELNGSGVTVTAILPERSSDRAGVGRAVPLRAGRQGRARSSSPAAYRSQPGKPPARTRGTALARRLRATHRVASFPCRAARAQRDGRARPRPDKTRTRRVVPPTPSGFPVRLVSAPMPEFGAAATQTAPVWNRGSSSSARATGRHRDRGHPQTKGIRPPHDSGKGLGRWAASGTGAATPASPATRRRNIYQYSFATKPGLVADLLLGNGDPGVPPGGRR